MVNSEASVCQLIYCYVLCFSLIYLVDDEDQSTSLSADWHECCATSGRLPKRTTDLPQGENSWDA